MKRTHVFFVVAMLAGALAAGASETETPVDAPDLSYQDQVDLFFERIDGGQFKEAIEELYRTNPWMTKIEDQVNQLKGQFMTLPDMAGEVFSHDLIIEQRVSDRFVLMWYVVSFGRTPVSFRFWFYRPQESWMIFAFQYEDDLQKIALELATTQVLYGARDGEMDTGNQHAVDILLNRGSH